MMTAPPNFAGLLRKLAIVDERDLRERRERRTLSLPSDRTSKPQPVTTQAGALAPPLT